MMLSEMNTPKRSVSQAAVKNGTCLGCGKPVQYRTNPRICCDECKIERKRASARAAMERQRRKRGIEQVKGRVIQCACCKCDVVLNRSVRAKHCADCYRVKNGLDARHRSEKKQATPDGRAYLAGWHREKYRSDPGFRVSAHMRGLIHGALGKKKSGRSWRRFVPYSLEELMLHLERQFLPGMTWDNQGRGWHIDHIIPRSHFTFDGPQDSGFQACWALTNLRPLWAKDNIRKNASRTHLL